MGHVAVLKTILSREPHTIHGRGATKQNTTEQNNPEKRMHQHPPPCLYISQLTAGLCCD